MMRLSEKDYLNKEQFHIHYAEIQSDAPHGTIPLVLIHGQCMCFRDYESVFEALSEWYHIFAVDCLGYGKSEKNAELYTCEKIGNLLCEFIEKVIGEPCIVSGHSSGGILAAYIAGQIPAMVKGLLLEDPPFFNVEPGEVENTFVYHVISCRNDNHLVFKTFDKAIAANPDAKPLFHSDRGFQYISKVFKRKLIEQEMEQSMSRVGHCIDNGPTEGFWGILKAEMYQLYEITNETSLRHVINDYIRFYSTERLQDRYHCKIPLEIRNEALQAKTVQEYPIAQNKRIEKYKEKGKL
ncbi:MAG TPA: alpha/beta fold hydrolase [Clostridiales bacterium]|nr:alpha/beta fold hydrolase [Clostridiales bacterium]